MNRLHLPQVRMLYVTTANTGGSLDITTVEGVAQLRRTDPHGVTMRVAGQEFSIAAESLPTIARFFAAAAIQLGVDINEGWDVPEVKL